MFRRFSPILAAVVASMLVGGLAWAASGDPGGDASQTTNPSTASSVAGTLAPTGTFTFGAGEAGDVTLVSDGASLQVEGVAATPGWTVEVQVATGREVEVSFRLGADRIDFKAEVEDGQIRVRVRDRAQGTEAEEIISNGDLVPADDSTPTTGAGDTTGPASSTPTTPADDDSTPTTSVGDTTATTVSDDDDSTSTTIADDDAGDDDSASTTIAEGDDIHESDDDSTSTTMPDTTATTVHDDTTSTTALDHDDSGSNADGTYTFPVAGAGSVTVTVSGGVLRLDGVSASSGWHATVEKDESQRVRVEFDNGDDDVEIDIRLEGGRLGVEVD